MAKKKKSSKFGSDLIIKGEEVYEDGELRVRNDLDTRDTGDLATVDGKKNIIQAIRHRLSTRKGELAELGHPNYGSLLHEMIGQPNTEGTRAIIETLVQDCLMQDPRIDSIQEIHALPRKDRSGGLSMIEIIVKLRLKETYEQLNVEIPFSLEETLY